MNGTVRRLADLRGQKNLLLTFFPKCFTGGLSEPSFLAPCRASRLHRQ
jgi:peroxiredoxin